MPTPPSALSSIQPAPYLRLLALATAGGVATLFGIGLAIQPQGLEKDPGPYQLTLPATPTGSAVAFRTAGMKALGRDPVHLRSVRVDSLPAGLGTPVVAAVQLDPTTTPGPAVVNSPVPAAVVEGTKVTAGQTWALVVTVTPNLAGHYVIPGLTVGYDVAGHHKSRHYSMDVSLTATS